jgi:ribosomal protein S18 acetylase RimI-like enzyme
MNPTWKNETKDVNWQELSALYRAAGMGSKSPESLQTAFTNSRYCLFVYLGQRLVGAGRAMADGADCSYLCDIALLPEFQGKGFGQKIVSRLMELSRGHRKIILFAVPGKEPFYARFGFRRMKTAMAIFENQQTAIECGLVEAE